MDISHPRISKIISCELSCNGPSRPSSISVSFLKLSLDCIKAAHFSFCIKIVIKLC